MWVKVPVCSQDKLYLDYPITKLKICELATACKQYDLNIELITYLRDYENKDDLQVQLKIPSISFKAMLDHDASDEPSNKPKKIITTKFRIPMNLYMVLIGAFN